MSKPKTPTVINWDQPTAVTQLDIVFGGKIEKLLPPWSDIPQEFKDGKTKWNKVISAWFFSGLPEGTQFNPKAGVDAPTAKRHMKAILRSWEPKHEHKEAGCSFLMSKWFEDVIIPKP